MLHTQALHALFLATASIPSPVLFAVRWVVLGILSCCALGAGIPATALYLYPLQYKMQDSPSETMGLAILYYGIGSLLGELPGYFFMLEAQERFRTRLQHRFDRGDLSLLSSMKRMLGSD
eukprot:Sspe_Gene.107007::Locus_85082_Transcript_1_1_Confidence_1.000_Length_407::g.107007::m.107007